jgi:CRP-like cAMP-binding protein
MEKNRDGTVGEYQENLNYIRQVDFFSGLPIEAIKVFAYLCRRETIKAGDYLFRQDEEDDRAYYIISGTLQLTRTVDGDERGLRDYAEGAFFGRLSLMGNIRRLFSLRAVEDVTCLTITRERVTKTMAQFPDVAPKMATVIVENVFNWEKRYLATITTDSSQCLREIGVSLV